MISVEKIRIYERFCGDIDGFARCGTELEKRTITDEEWYQIEHLIQRLSLVKRMAATKSYKSETAQIVSSWVLNESALAALNKLTQ